MAELGTSILIQGLGRAVRWLGRSGQAYELAAEDFARFAMNDADLYLIAKGGHVLWVGSVAELVSDPISRRRFRLALDCGDRALRLDAAGLAAERTTTIWDLEGAEPMLDARAA